jgi:competence protein ComGC
VELMVIIAVIGLLAVIAAPLLRQFLARGWSASCLSNRYHIDRAETQYLLDRNQNSGALQDLVTAGLLSAVPACPAGGVYAWLLRSPDPHIGCSVHFASLAGQAADNTVFATNFADLAGIRSLTGNWSIANGALVPRINAENRLAFVTTADRDYTVNVTATLTDGNGWGVYYRSDGVAGNNNPGITGYVFQFDPGLGNRFVVRQVLNGREQAPFQSVAMPAGFPVYNTAHAVSVSVQGNQHVITVDGQVVLRFTDSTFQTGVAGLRSWSGSQVAFTAASITVP